jgi:hypothetical protein
MVWLATSVLGLLVVTLPGAGESAVGEWLVELNKLA